MAVVDSGTNMVLTPLEASALHHATRHAFRECLRWAADEVPVDKDDVPTEDAIEQLGTALIALHHCGVLLDRLGWAHDAHVDISASESDYVTALAVLACEFNEHEHAILSHDEANALAGLLIRGPELDEEEAWRIVFQATA